MPQFAHVEFFACDESPPRGLYHDGGAYLNPQSFRLLLAQVPSHEAFDYCRVFVQKLTMPHLFDFPLSEDSTQAFLYDQCTLVSRHPLHFSSLAESPKDKHSEELSHLHASLALQCLKVELTSTDHSESALDSDCFCVTIPVY